MASIIEDLINVLEQTTGCYQELRELASNKKDVIIQGDLPSLQSLTETEQGVAGRLLRLEKKRIEILKDVCLVTNQNVKTMTISKLIDFMKTRPQEQVKLINASDRLMTIVDEVKKINDLNQALLQESLSFVSFTMNAIQSASEAPTGSNYQKKGNYYNSPGTTNFFDAKQ